MWRQQKKDSSMVSLALLLALTTIPTTTLLGPAPMLAQSATETPAFPLPQSVENGTTIRIDGADSLAGINQELKQGFEKQFSGAKVEVATNGTDAALKALVDGKVDLVALGRGLTKQEKAQGLEQVRLRREKIAIAVDAENPFQGSLTNKQVAKIFRGEITDWSQLGAPQGKIRIIDRPKTSDTRNNLRNSPTLKKGKFVDGSNVTQATEDNTAEIVKQLGKDGISYGLATQLSKLQNVRVINVDDISPDSPNYIFSQPLVYAYKKNPSPGVGAFLGFAIALPGQKAIEDARTAEAEAIAQAKSPTVPAAEATTGVTPSAVSEAVTAPIVSASEQPSATSPTQNSSSTNSKSFLWLLPLLVAGGLLLWWFLLKGLSADTETDNQPESTPSPASEAAETDNTNSDLDAGTTLTASNSVDNITAPTSNAAAENPENKVVAGTTNFSDSPVVIAPDASEAAWDIEAPAAVVNPSYPQLPDVPVGESETPAIVSELTAPPEVSPHTQELPAAHPQTAPSVAEDSPSTVDAALAGGTALAAGAAIWSAVSDTDSDTQENNQTINNSNSTEIESPATPAITADTELPASESSTTVTESPAITADTELPASESSTAVTESPAITADTELPASASTTVAESPELPELPELALNEVADAAELTTDSTEEETIEIVSNLPEETNETSNLTAADVASGAALAAGAGIGAWASIYGIENASDANTEVAHQVDNQPVLSQSTAASPDKHHEASIVLKPHTPKWAYATWEIADAAVTGLTLRLYDVTALDLSYQQPHLVQEYQVDAAIGDRFVAIPQSNRDYISEIGYLSNGQWVKLATSPPIRVFSLPYIETQPVGTAATQPNATLTLTSRTPKWAYATWEIANAAVTGLTLRLYDVTALDLSYQQPHLVQEYPVDAATSDRFVAIPQSDHDYISEIGYLSNGEWVKLATSPPIRVFSLPHVATPPAGTPANTNITLSPHSPKWAYAAWEIVDAAVTGLTLRLYDVTALDLSYQQPHLVQEYPVDAATGDLFVAIPQSDHDYISEIGYLSNGEWVKLATSTPIRVFSLPYIETQPAGTAATQPNATITLTSRTPKWAYATWEIADAAVTGLTLRLYDVTALDLSYQQPHFVQEYPVDAATSDRFVAIPKSDHDYISEIGYLNNGEWVKLATSPPIRVFSLPHVATPLVGTAATQPNATITLTPRTPKWAYAAWEIPTSHHQEIANAGVSELGLRLYDVTGLDLSYQDPHLVQQYEVETVTSDRFVAIPKSDRDYISEIGYVANGKWVKIATSTPIRVFSRPDTDFWLVADAELIIHGATEPNAIVSIGGHTIKLKPDGTFHLRLPFSDSLIEYIITAAAADQKHTKTIHKKFSQETPET